MTKLNTPFIITLLLAASSLVTLASAAADSYPTKSYRNTVGCDASKTYQKADSPPLLYSEGQCHSSWALALAAALSDSHCRFHIKAKRYTLAKKLFSAQHLLECCHEARYIAQEPCLGGNIETAVNWVKDNGVLVSIQERVETQPTEPISSSQKID